MTLYKASFSGCSVNNIAKAKTFYTDTLGLQIDNEEMGLQLALPNGHKHFLYEKDDHEPATYTVLNLVVEDIDATVESLSAKGVKFDHYNFGNGAESDEKGIMRGIAAKMGPDIAWFKDPAENTLAVLQLK
jgi:catechol 2,3-dioxygenase-like lactoylglutathione lyase family enzyme